MRADADDGPSAAVTHGLQTLAVHAGEPQPRFACSAVAPIFQSATFVYDGSQSGYNDVLYTRCNNNPSQQVLGAKLAALEGAEAALPLASGMAAIASTMLTLLRAGDHLIIQHTAYGGTYDLAHKDLKELGISASMIDAADPGSWEAALQPNTRVLYVEAVSNPLVQVPDLEAVIAFARQHSLVAVIDSTMATPALLRPVLLGFDLVVHSATKFLNGHSDVIAGVVAGSSALVERVRAKANHLGGSLDPHSCFLVQRGLKTLGLRMQRQCANALALAEALEAHPQVSKVHYPGLPSHPQHGLVKRLFTNGCAGGVLSFECTGGAEAADAMLAELRLALVAPSLGGIETLVGRSALMSHAGLTPEERAAAGISESLIRVAVGIEDTEDLVADFLAALDTLGAPANGGQPAG